MISKGYAFIKNSKGELVPRKDPERYRMRVIWWTMVRRCTNPKSQKYSIYGARGIKVCERWRTFENFLTDMGIGAQGLTLDRIDNNGNYEPGNCRWTTKKINNRNRRDNLRLNINGEMKTAAEWAELSGISLATVLQRHHAGWPESVILSPVKTGIKKEQRIHELKREVWVNTDTMRNLLTRIEVISGLAGRIQRTAVTDEASRHDAETIIRQCGTLKNELKDAVLRETAHDHNGAAKNEYGN